MTGHYYVIGGVTQMGAMTRCFPKRSRRIKRLTEPVITDPSRDQLSARIAHAVPFPTRNAIGASMQKQGL